MYFRFNAKPLNTDNMFLKIPQIISSFPNIRENRVYFCKYHCRNSQHFFFLMKDDHIKMRKLSEPYDMRTLFH